MSTQQNQSSATQGLSELSGLVSQRQLKILRHALGWPKKYRNHYCTGEGSDDFADCETLVSAGMMTRHKKSWVPDYIYTVTEQGKAVAG